MKIERINSNQVRCILTKQDLSDRHIRISELAYRTEKAKKLFRDMMREASNHGFEAEDVPLMIEAIPGASESLELIITKVEDPEELDTRFSRFTTPDEEEYYEEEIDFEDQWIEEGDEYHYEECDLQPSGCDEEPSGFIEQSVEAELESEYEDEEEETPAIRRLYMFDNLENLIRSCERIVGSYQGISSAYKENSRGTYYLLLENPGKPVKQFNWACNEVAEYGKLQKSGPVRLAYMKEHTTGLISSKAVEKLGSI